MGAVEDAIRAEIEIVKNRLQTLERMLVDSERTRLFGATPKATDRTVTRPTEGRKRRRRQPVAQSIEDVKAVFQKYGSVNRKRLERESKVPSSTLSTVLQGLIEERLVEDTGRAQYGSRVYRWIGGDTPAEPEKPAAPTPKPEARPNEAPGTGRTITPRKVRQVGSPVTARKIAPKTRTIKPRGPTGEGRGQVIVALKYRGSSGTTVKEMAERTGFTGATVRKHLSNLQKDGVAIYVAPPGGGRIGTPGTWYHKDYAPRDHSSDRETVVRAGEGVRLGRHIIPPHQRGGGTDG